MAREKGEDGGFVFGSGKGKVHSMDSSLGLFSPFDEDVFGPDR